MAVSTIEFDKDGLPVSTKYCIVALGNLETTKWSKSDVYAPVISQNFTFSRLWQFDTNMFSKISMKNKHTPKQCCHPMSNTYLNRLQDAQEHLPTPTGCSNTLYMDFKEALATGLREPLSSLSNLDSLNALTQCVCSTVLLFLANRHFILFFTWTTLHISLHQQKLWKNLKNMLVT